MLATRSARDLVFEIWLPDASIRRERELARFRLHLVRHRTTLKNRIHAALVAFGHPCPVSDLFGHCVTYSSDMADILKFAAVYEQAEDGWAYAHVPELPEVHTQGRDLDEARAIGYQVERTGANRGDPPHIRGRAR